MKHFFETTILGLTVSQIIGIVVVLALAILGAIFILKKSKKHDLIKWICLFIFVSIAFTWIFAYGYYDGTQYYAYGMNQLGITDIPNLIFNAIYFAGDKLIFLFALGAFYAILTRCNGYKKLVSTLAKKLKGKEVIFALLASLFFTASSAIFTQSFIGLVFVPFIISVALEMKLDKLSTFAITFGSLLVGTMGTIYGGEGLYWFNYYTGASVKTAILYRVLILVVAYALFNFLNILHMRKVAANNINEVEVDPFKVEKYDDKRSARWPYIALFGIIFALIVLGYVGWENTFGITVFTKFHEWLLDLHIGEFYVFKVLLGSLAEAFGAWDLFHISVILIIFSIIFALIGNVKLNDFITSYSEGIKKLSLPIVLFLATYVVFLAPYIARFVPTIVNIISGGMKSFNPFILSLDAIIANIFHTDFGFTGFTVARYFIIAYAANINVIHTLFITLYGLINLFVPTSAMLLIGLSYLKIDYKSYVKYIWIFAVAMLVILLVLFTVMTYI